METKKLRCSNCNKEISKAYYPRRLRTCSDECYLAKREIRARNGMKYKPNRYMDILKSIYKPNYVDIDKVRSLEKQGITITEVK